MWRIFLFIDKWKVLYLDDSKPTKKSFNKDFFVSKQNCLSKSTIIEFDNGLKYFGCNVEINNDTVLVAMKLIIDIQENMIGNIGNIKRVEKNE